MRLSISLQTPKHWYGVKGYKHRGMTAWFYKPDKHSTGGVGFQFFFLHCVFTWGYR